MCGAPVDTILAEDVSRDAEGVACFGVAGDLVGGLAVAVDEGGVRVGFCQEGENEGG